MSSRRASFIGFYPALLIFNVECYVFKSVPCLEANKFSLKMYLEVTSV